MSTVDQNNTLHSTQIRETEPRHVLRLRLWRHFHTADMWRTWVDGIAFNGIIDSTFPTQCKWENRLHQVEAC